ncbi:hypothetical protein PR048_013649 [Dryococelus australis]|uniref:Uncharacterized protein n=1 Tax=Dryococelus australis TaxID=614101 RepID=A0ABQ9HST0_9NEOP|nr:hypothetical protein PR048_013649 [Dryococelus australis]
MKLDVKSQIIGVITAATRQAHFTGPCPTTVLYSTTPSNQHYNGSARQYVTPYKTGYECYQDSHSQQPKSTSVDHILTPLTGSGVDTSSVNTPGRKDGGKREIPEKSRRQAASSGRIPTCENPGVARPKRFAFVGGEQSNRSATVAPPYSFNLIIASGKIEILLWDEEQFVVVFVHDIFFRAIYDMAFSWIGAAVAERLACSPPNKANRGWYGHFINGMNLMAAHYFFTDFKHEKTDSILLSVIFTSCRYTFTEADVRRLRRQTAVFTAESLAPHKLEDQVVLGDAQANSGRITLAVIKDGRLSSADLPFFGAPSRSGDNSAPREVKENIWMQVKPRLENQKHPGKDVAPRNITSHRQYEVRMPSTSKCREPTHISRCIVVGFFICGGALKNIVYTTKPRTLNSMIDVDVIAFESTLVETVATVCRSVLQRCRRGTPFTSMYLRRNAYMYMRPSGGAMERWSESWVKSVCRSQSADSDGPVGDVGAGVKEVGNAAHDILGTSAEKYGGPIEDSVGVTAEYDDGTTSTTPEEVYGTVVTTISSGVF